MSCTRARFLGPRSRSQPGQRSNCAAHANLMKLHRKIKHNDKVCRAHDLGSYAQGQGPVQVKGHNLVSAITQKLLKQI